jgi:hypothetical protein
MEIMPITLLNALKRTTKSLCVSSPGTMSEYATVPMDFLQERDAVHDEGRGHSSGQETLP